MRLATFLIVLCLYLFQCHAASPGEVATTTRARRVPFTKEEDELIINELSRLPVDKLQIFSKFLWESLAMKHREKWIQNAPGFTKERSGPSLLGRFKTMAKYNNPRLNSKVPEHLLKANRVDLNFSAQGTKPPYTEIEEAVIIEELLKPSCYGVALSWAADVICEKLNEKHKSGNTEFKKERTAESVRRHIWRLKRTGRLGAEVLKNIQFGAKAQRPVYTTEEEQVIVNELLNPSCVTLNEISTLKAIRATLDDKSKAGTPGFNKERSTSSLARHISKMQQNGKLPDEILNKIRKYANASSASSSRPPPPNLQPDIEISDEEGEEDNEEEDVEEEE